MTCLEIYAGQDIAGSLGPHQGRWAERTEATGESSLVSGRTDKWFLEPDERAA
jgi:hypothetical protein